MNFMTVCALKSKLGLKFLTEKKTISLFQLFKGQYLLAGPK